MGVNAMRFTGFEGRRRWADKPLADACSVSSHGPQDGARWRCACRHCGAPAAGRVCGRLPGGPPGRRHRGRHRAAPGCRPGPRRRGCPAAAFGGRPPPPRLLGAQRARPGGAARAPGAGAAAAGGRLLVHQRLGCAGRASWRAGREGLALRAALGTALAPGWARPVASPAARLTAHTRLFALRRLRRLPSAAGGGRPGGGPAGPSALPGVARAAAAPVLCGGGGRLRAGGRLLPPLLCRVCGPG